MEEVYLRLSINDYNSIVKSLVSTKCKRKVEVLRNSIIQSSDVQNLHLKSVHNSKVQKSKDIILKEIERLKAENVKATIYLIAKNTGLSYHTVKKYFTDEMK